MFCATVLYPHEEGSVFDFEHHAGTSRRCVMIEDMIDLDSALASRERPFGSRSR